MKSFSINGLSVSPGTRAFTRLSVAQMLVGAELSLPLHVVHGVKPGPVLGLLALIHGSEYVPVRMMADALRSVDPSQLSGTILAIPVANPLAFANRTRNTPEKDSDIANLNRVFPGGVGVLEYGKERTPGDRGLTERMADVITEAFLPHLTDLLDFHHTQEPRCNRVAMFRRDDNEVGQRSYELSRAVGVGMLQQVDPTTHPGNAGGTAMGLGVATSIVEVGGGFLGRDAERASVEIGARAIINALKHLKMLEGAPVLPEKQILVTKRATARPSKAGYFMADIEAEDLINDDPVVSLSVSKGQRLARVLDPYSLEVIEEIFSPVDGYPVVLRRTGLCEAGDRGIAIGIKEHCTFIE